MAKITVCDHRDGKEPCGNRADVTASLRWDDKNWELDLCDVHAKALTTNARAGSTPPPRPSVTVVPPTSTTATGRQTLPPLVEKIDYPDMRAWLMQQGLIPDTHTKAPVKRDLQQKWIDAGEPRPV